MPACRHPDIRQLSIASAVVWTILKITIGSFEHRVLTGARESIARHRPHIAMLAYPENEAAVRGFLDEIGGYREVPCPYPSTANIRIFQPS